MRHSGFVLLALLAASTTACAELKGLILPGAKPAAQAPAVTTPFARTVTGQVQATPGLTVQAVTEAALVDAEVYLADGAGNRLPGMTTRTNAQGRFVFTGVPSGYTFLVVAKTRANGKEALLQSLVHTTEAGAATDVNATTTLVSVGVLQDLGEALGKFDPEAYERAVSQAAARLGNADLPDLSDRGAVRAKFVQLQQELAELKTNVDQLRGELQASKVSLTDVKAQLAKREAEQAAIAAAIASRPKLPATEASPKPTATAAPDQIEHAFFAYPGKFQSNDYPVTVEFRKKGTTEVAAKLTLTGDSQKAKATVKYDLPYDLWVSTQRKADPAVYWHGFTLTSAAKYEVALPFADKENPLVEHTFKLPVGKFAEEDFPLAVEFREKDGSLIVAKLKYDDATKKPAGKLRHGMEYDLWVLPKTKLKPEVMRHGWSIPEGASKELELPFK